MKILLPEKLGPRKKIWAIIQRLQSEAHIEVERNGVSVTYTETLEPRSTNNGPPVINVNCSTPPPPATASLLPPASQKQVTEEVQETSCFSSKDMIAVVPSEVEVIYPDLINDQNNINILQQSASMQTEECDINYPSAPSSSEAPSNFMQITVNTISSLLNQIRPDLDYSPFELYQTSVPEKSDSTNTTVDEAKEEKQSKINDPKEKAETRHGRRHHNKYKPENESKRSDRKVKYNNPNAHSYKIPVPHKIIESRKKLPIYKYKEQFLNVRKLRYLLMTVN